MDGILFVSSHNTGYGHRSITEALKEQLSWLDPAVAVDDIDGFKLGGRLSDLLSRMYDRVAVKAPLFWKVYYQMGNIFPHFGNLFIRKGMEKSFMKLVDDTRPRLIVSVHPCYVSSVLDILEKYQRNIPVVSLVADLDNVARMWADPRSLYTICPTENARRTMLKYRVPDEKIKVTGFPVRDRFNHFNADPGISYYKQVCGKKRLNFLIMNGSQGLKLVTEIAKELLEGFDCNVTILAGNNKSLKESVQKALSSYTGRVAVCGFVSNVEQYMQESDILLLRASPNVLMEAVNLCKPVVITGALTGQEEKNPEFAAENKLGAVCRNIRRLPETINRLMESEGKGINEIYEHQVRFRKPEAAEEIAKMLLTALKGDYHGGSDTNV